MDQRHPDCRSGCIKLAERTFPCPERCERLDEIARRVGKAIEQAYPWGYHSEDKEP